MGSSSRPVWEKYPELSHLPISSARDQLESRRRHRQVRYWLFRLKTAVEKSEPLNDPPLLPHFVDFWLAEKPAYQMAPMQGGALARVPVADVRNVSVAELGGYMQFAIKWEVDADLKVYLRHSSVWQEWNATLMRVVPVLGE